MKRVLLLVALTLGALGAFGGVASAGGGGLPTQTGNHEDINTFEILNGFTVRNVNNTVTDSGPKVRFRVLINCDQPGDLGMFFHVDQDPGEPTARQGGPEGTGGRRVNCTGNNQVVVINVTRNDNSPTFDDDDPLYVEGIAAHINPAGDVTDLDFDAEVISSGGVTR